MRRALVVDDEELLRQLISETLDAAGWEVEVAGDAAAARARLAAAPFDVVIIDVHLTGAAGGIALCRELAAAPEAPATLLTSGHSDAHIVAQGLAAGARGFVAKPFRPAELVAAVEAVLGP